VKLAHQIEVQLPLIRAHYGVPMSLKQHIVLILGAGIGALGVLGWIRGTMTPRVLEVIVIGVVVSITYVVAGGRLPDWLKRFVNVTDDDDPSNLPVRLYLPILAAVLVVAGVLLYFGLRR
jgi:hypothetical protein